MSEIKLEKKDLTKNYWRINLFPMCTINYERFQSMQYCFSLIPIIKKLYPDNREERIRAAQRHMEFYNTTPVMINWTMGINVAQEEKIANMPDGDEREALIASVSAVKTSLMGPLAGIGDSLGATVHAILGSVSAGIALTGNIFGAILYFIGSNAYYFGLGWNAYNYSYNNGTKAIMDFNKSGIMQRVMDSATILGITSLGSLIPSWIGFNLNRDFDVQGNIINIQAELNKIFPGLVPLAITLILAQFYNKRVSALKLVGIIFVAAFLMALAGFGA